MARAYEEILREATTVYLGTIDVNNPPSAQDIQEAILDNSMVAIQLENQVRAKGTYLKVPSKLTPAQIADIILKLYDVRNIAFAGLKADAEFDVLAVYQKEGKDKGIYVTDKDTFYSLIQQYSYSITDKDVNETMITLKHKAKRVERNNKRNLIAVNNGIFDYDAKQLLEFSPDYIFTSKSKVDYNPNAINVVIHNPDDNTDWDVESWMKDLFDGNDDLTTLMWEIIGAIIRPNVSWNKSAWFYSHTGNNGKGTLCELMRQIAGDGTYAAIPLTDFSKDFMLEPLLKASCIIVDENDVGAFIDKAAILKAIITNDVIQMNRKYKQPVAFQFKGFMVQCLNEMPKFKDKSESFYRRQLFVPFTKCFTGAERKYIKNEYLHNKYVLEYVLYKVLNMNYYTLSEPEECKQILKQYKEFNDPVKQFVEEIFDELKWDLLPYSFLYDLYKAWFKRVSPTGTLLGRQTFIQDINRLMQESDKWDIIPDKMRPATKMDDAEPLIAEYNLTDWFNPLYRGSDIEKKCHPFLKNNYRGLVRKT